MKLLSSGKQTSKEASTVINERGGNVVASAQTVHEFCDVLRIVYYCGENDKGELVLGTVTILRKEEVRTSED